MKKIEKKGKGVLITKYAKRLRRRITKQITFGIVPKIAAKLRAPSIRKIKPSKQLRLIDSNIIRVYNSTHLGDCIYSIMFLNQLKGYLETTGKTIVFACNSQYINQVKEFVQANITVVPLPESKGLHIWIGNRFFKAHYYSGNIDKYGYDGFFIRFNNDVLRHLNIPIRLHTFAYTDPDLLVRYDKLPVEYQDVDYLIINSVPLSHQYRYNKGEWDKRIKELAKKMKVVTTLKVAGVPCTMDINLTLKGIGAVSTKAKNIIAVNTGPLSACMNTYALSYCKKWVIFGRVKHYSYPKFHKGHSVGDIV